MKEKRDFSTCNMVIGAILGAIVFILFLLMFPRVINSAVGLVLGRNTYWISISDPLYIWKDFLFEAFQFFFALFFIFAGVFLALCITKKRNEAWMSKAIKNIIISLLVAPIAYSSLNIIGLSYFYYYARRLLGDAAFLLAVNFSEGMLGLVLSLFVSNLKQYPKVKIKLALAGLISGWICSALIFIVFVRLNLEGNDLRILVRNSQVPLTVACVGSVILLMEKRVNRKLEELAAHHAER